MLIILFFSTSRISAPKFIFSTNSPDISHFHNRDVYTVGCIAHHFDEDRR